MGGGLLGLGLLPWREWKVEGRGRGGVGLQGSRWPLGIQVASRDPGGLQGSRWPPGVQMASYHTDGMHSKGIGERGEQEGLANQARNWHWDKRKKRYIMLQPGETVTAGKRGRSESGVKSKRDAASTGLYRKWMKSSQQKVAAPGDLEEPSSSAQAPDLSKR